MLNGEKVQVIKWETLQKEGLPISNNNTSMTIGNFDGVHRGHKALIDIIIQYDKNLIPVVITFRYNLKKNIYPGDILSFSQKIEIFENLGAAIVVVADLTESFRFISGVEFLRLLREHGKIGFLAIGSNFQCGYGRDLDAHKIREINSLSGIPTEIIETRLSDSHPISSSRIRSAIIKGNLKEAETMLGRRFILDIKSPTSIRPPQGTYKVLFHKELNTPPVPGEIQITKTNLILSNLDTEYEYIEFLS